MPLVRFRHLNGFIRRHVLVRLNTVDILVAEKVLGHVSSEKTDICEAQCALLALQVGLALEILHPLEVLEVGDGHGAVVTLLVVHTEHLQRVGAQQLVRAVEVEEEVLDDVRVARGAVAGDLALVRHLVLDVGLHHVLDQSGLGAEGRIGYLVHVLLGHLGQDSAILDLVFLQLHLAVKIFEAIVTLRQISYVDSSLSVRVHLKMKMFHEL